MVAICEWLLEKDTIGFWTVSNHKRVLHAVYYREFHSAIPPSV